MRGRIGRISRPGAGVGGGAHGGRRFDSIVNELDLSVKFAFHDRALHPTQHLREVEEQNIRRGSRRRRNRSSSRTRRVRYTRARRMLREHMIAILILGLRHLGGMQTTTRGATPPLTTRSPKSYSFKISIRK